MFPGVAGVGGEMGVVSGFDGAVEDVDDVVVLLQADVEIEFVALGFPFDGRKRPENHPFTIPVRTL